MSLIAYRTYAAHPSPPEGISLNWPWQEQSISPERQTEMEALGYTVLSTEAYTAYRDLVGCNPAPSALELEEQKAKMILGAELSATAVLKIGALNVYLGKSGTQVTAVLNALAPIKALLETGALSTASYYMSQVSAAYPEYESVISEAQARISALLTELG